MIELLKSMTCPLLRSEHKAVFYSYIQTWVEMYRVWGPEWGLCAWSLFGEYWVCDREKCTRYTATHLTVSLTTKWHLSLTICCWKFTSLCVFTNQFIFTVSHDSDPRWWNNQKKAFLLLCVCIVLTVVKHVVTCIEKCCTPLLYTLGPSSFGAGCGGH